MEWISVEDRLPDMYKSVIVCTARGTVEQGWLTVYGNWECAVGVYSIQVTHWMPLPEPPKIDYV